MDQFNQLLNSNSISPEKDLFFSAPWKERFQLTKINAESALRVPTKKLNIFSTLGQELADYEILPQDPEILANRTESAKKMGCDWVVFRKLRTPCSGALLYSHAPYLDLTQPIEMKKDTGAHLNRTERKITREIGPLVYKVSKTPDEMEKWFSTWKSFHTAVNHFDEERFGIYRSWIFDAPLPDWFRLVTLFAGERAVACGLFYQYDSVFYFFSPAQNHDEDLKKYGVGKLFVQKLIDHAKEEGCREFDFLQGAYPYKLHWNPKLRPLYQKIIPLSAFGHLAYYGMLGKQTLRNLRK